LSLTAGATSRDVIPRVSFPAIIAAGEISYLTVVRLCDALREFLHRRTLRNFHEFLQHEARKR